MYAGSDYYYFQLALVAMPKKFKGENSKAVEARERKSAAKREEADRKQKAAEDAYWADDDKQNAKKAQRKVLCFFSKFTWSKFILQKRDEIIATVYIQSRKTKTKNDRSN